MFRNKTDPSKPYRKLQITLNLQPQKETSRPKAKSATLIKKYKPLQLTYFNPPAAATSHTSPHTTRNKTTKTHSQSPREQPKTIHLKSPKGKPFRPQDAFDEMQPTPTPQNHPLNTTKPHLKMSSKFFRKEQRATSRLDNLTRTLERPKPQKPRYMLRMLKRIGKSQTGEILLATSNDNGMVVAIKTFKRDKTKLEYLVDEMKIHLYCEHPHILPAYGYHISRDEVFLVMEYGFNNLYSVILKHGPFSEGKGAHYIAQILSGLEYLHRNGVMHRDLKPQNIICFNDHLKITDFGWSIKTQTHRRTLCGTMDYISPQVAERSYYDNKIDIWSAGVLLYEMFTMRPPFPQNKKEYDFDAPKMPEFVSSQCRQFMEWLLQVDPQSRPSAREALEHPWLGQVKQPRHSLTEKAYRQLVKDAIRVL